MNAVDVVRCRYVLEGIFKEFKDFIRTQLFMQMIGNGFCGIAHSLAHLRRQIQAVFRLQNIADTALSRLAVDADDVCIVVSSDIGRIDRQIRNGPGIRCFLLDPVHAFCDRILMGTGEGCKYERSAVRASRVDAHTGEGFKCMAEFRHIGEVKLRIDALHVHVHADRDNIHVSGSLAVSEQRSLDTVCSGKDTHLCIGNAAAAVIVRMKGKNDIIAVFQVFAHVFHLACINVRHGKLHGARQVDDGFAVCSRLPYVENGVAHLKRIFRLGSGKALRAVLEAVFLAGLFCQLF